MEAKLDVVICGAGLAGLTLARQLKLELPDLSIAVIDRQSRPLPEAAHKVGESSNELASYYFGKVLRLEDYLKQRQLQKFSLRFFFGDARGAFEARPELGPAISAPLPTYQLDRGRLENDLRAMAEQMGVVVYEGATVDDIDIGTGGEPHTVRCRRIDSSERFTLQGRWVVDALGRRRLLSTKLHLTVPSLPAGSAAWWRIDGRIDVGQLGVGGGRRWQGRIIDDRYLSTNHLMGRGYWVWLIPLASGVTSLGIVTDETIHPFATYGKSYAQALQWLSTYEPALWQLINTRESLDFHGLKNYSYGSRQVFSHDRWACIGDAGFFLDPLYSPGSDFIAVENTITTELIRRDFSASLDEADVDQFNHLLLDFLVPDARSYYTDTYRTFGHAHIFTAKLGWDVGNYWAMLAQLYFQGLVSRPSAEVFELLSRYKALNARVQRLLIDWADSAPPRAPFEHADITRMRFLQLLYLDLVARRSTDQFLEVARKNLDRMEELAQLLFWQAVAECLPEHRPAEGESLPWINAWAISLDADRWEADGLYEPPTAPRSLRQMQATYAGVFRRMTWRELLEVELPYRIWTAARGKPVPALLRFVLRKFICDKPAMGMRQVFLRDQPSSPRAVPATAG